MVQRAAYSPISVRIAEEKQLLAEEKWIIEALTKIRKQRNCLMIERLELENLKTQLEMNSSRPQSRSAPDPSSASAPSTSSTPVESAVKLMTTKPAASTSHVQVQEALVNELNDEAFCNDQKLDLTVTNPILSLSYNNMMEEEEVESDESEDSADENNSTSLMIDMNMFMNGASKSKK